jgi:hypothetical protein
MKRNGRTSIGRVKVRSLIVALVVTVAALTASTGAYAAGSAQHTYGGQGGNVQAEIQGGAKDPGTQGTADPGTQRTAATASTPAGLPFTGLDLALMLGGGLVLVASGVTLGRLAVRGNRV